MAKWDGVVTPKAVARLREVMEGDLLNGQAVRGDGSGRIRPSSLSDPCPRAQLLSFHGYRSAIPTNTALMESGTWAHYRWQVNLLSAGILTDIEAPARYQPWYLKGSIDGAITDGTPLEIKQMGDRLYKRAISKKRQRPHDWHMFQTHGYMKALGVKQCSLLYENRDTLEWHEFRINYDPYVYGELNKRMDELVNHIDLGSMPDILTGCRDGTSTIYTKCLWKEACFVVGDDAGV